MRVGPGAVERLNLEITSLPIGCRTLICQYPVEFLPWQRIHPINTKQYDSLAWPVVVMESRWPVGTSTGWHSHPKGQLLRYRGRYGGAHRRGVLIVLPIARALDNHGPAAYRHDGS